MECAGKQECAGKTALVTGSGAIGGLGHATAKVLAAGGADLALTGTGPKRGAQVVKGFRAVGGESAGTVRFVAADVSDSAGVRQLAAAAEAVDILLNNASVMTFSPATGQDFASYDATFAVNVRAPSCSPLCSRRRWPRAVAASSTSNPPRPVSACRA